MLYFSYVADFPTISCLFLSRTPPACPAGQYKSTSSNTDSCQTCPQFSSASANGSQVCMCDIGYYRAPSDSSSTACTREERLFMLYICLVISYYTVYYYNIIITFAAFQSHMYVIPFNIQALLVLLVTSKLSF